MNRLSLAPARRAALLAPALAAALAGPSLAQPRVAVAALPSSAAPAPVDPERLAIAREVVALAYPPEKRQAMMMGVVDSMMAQIRQATFGPSGAPDDPGAQAIFERFVQRVRGQASRSVADASPALFDAFARAYARMFTRDELVQIRAFVATPAGAKYVERSSNLLADPDVARANTAYIAGYLAAVKPIQEELVRELTDYFAKRPPAKKL